MRTALRHAGIFSALVSASLLAHSAQPTGTWRIANAPPEWRDEISRADLIIVAMHDALQGGLRDALAQGGPAFAVKRSHGYLDRLIYQVALRERIVAGRTSDRLRNPWNKPAPWATSFVLANAGRNARDVDGFAVDLGYAVGVMRPVVEQRQCNVCHGAETEMTPDVRAAIKRWYPVDRATGFKEGEIRGWFWVEMPKRSSR